MRRAFAGWAGCLLVALGVGCRGRAGSGAPVVDPAIQGIVAAIDANRIAASEQALVGFVTRNTCSAASASTQGIGAARDWILAQLSAVRGLQTRLQPFAVDRCGPGTRRENVLAWIPGTAHPERLVIVGGHYDSRSKERLDPTQPAPGANDSGSQASLVIEVARAMGGHAFGATVVFATFAGEEQGLVGSSALAEEIGTLFPHADVVAMLNCDIVGGDNTANDAAALQQVRVYSPGTPREMGKDPDGTTDSTSPSRGVMRYVATWGSAYVPAMTVVPKLREDRPGRGGDHEPFIARGYPAVRFIERNENLAHQHTPDDVLQYVTPAYTARVAAVVAAVAASLASAPAPPGSLHATGPAASPSLSWSAPPTGGVDHFVVAARPAGENLYHPRVRVEPGATAATVSPRALGVDPGGAYFVSVAAVDAAGHESLFAYPELRCEGSGCVVPKAALDVRATQ